MNTSAKIKYDLSQIFNIKKLKYTILKLLRIFIRIIFIKSAHLLIIVVILNFIIHFIHLKLNQVH